MTDGLTIILYMKLADIRDVDAIPATYMGDIQEKRSWLQRMSCRIVERIFNPTAQKDVDTALKAMSEELKKRRKRPGNLDEIFPYCSCGQGNLIFIYL